MWQWYGNLPVATIIVIDFVANGDLSIRLPRSLIKGDLCRGATKS